MRAKSVLQHLVLTFLFFSFPLFSQTNDEGHGPKRVSGSIGYSSLGSFAEIQFRPAYHDLLNTDKGFVPNSETQVMNGAVRYYEGSRKLELTRLNVIRMYSLNPYNSISESKTYALDLGAETVTVKTKHQPFWKDKEEYSRITPVNAEASYGYSFQNEFSREDSPFLFTVMAGVKAQAHGYFKNEARIAPQGVLNFLYNIGSWKIQTYYAYHYYNISQNENDYTANLRLRYAIQKNHEVRFEFSKHTYYQDVSFSYHYLF
ncbi:hypothetical protein LPTSP3_g35610 [Leptospira kobayashii]|uniref:DUF7840 domain-containing protein n=1 Tax=Leptospira kobayashii TaxID=1917830 RepID=A0ABM7UNB5_9LEPT|nr:hypothetical protein LPTSP3_g35610 [Leptospira kobayashii]